MLNDADERLARLLPHGVLRDISPAYLEEPRGRWQGRAGLVAAPRDAEECGAVIAACAKARVPVVPRGGGTGLVGGQVMPDGPLPLILTLERMQAIRDVSVEERLIVAEAGATLQSVRDAAGAVGLQFPLLLASQGTAQIGGVLSTNAGGVNVLRYGNARALCLGIEAVLPSGQVMRDMKRLRKDNTGYDLRDLLIGAEGTLGVITAATLILSPIPAERGVALMVVESPDAALQLLAQAQAQMAGGVSAFELISGQGLRFMRALWPDLRQPFADIPDWLVLIEVGLPAGLPADSALERLYVTGAEAGLVCDGVIAQSARQAEHMWSLREQIPAANRAVGAIASHDISLPLAEIPSFLHEAEDWLSAQADMRINCFGHLGDGNLHFNLFPAEGFSRDAYEGLRAGLSAGIHEMVVARGGSFSAEHGIGRLKVAELAQWGDPARLGAMRAIKAALDPAGIMNPGAVLG